MIRFLILVFLLHPFFSKAQIVNTVEIEKEVDSLLKIATEFWRSGKNQEALPIAQQMANISKEKLGENSPRYATSLHRLASINASLNQNDQAEALYLKAIDLRAKLLGKEHPLYLASMSNLAILYDQKREYNKAERLQLEIKSIREKVLGKEHPDYSASLNNLATLYQNSGEYDKAEPLYLEAISLREKVLGKNNPDYLWSVYNLANLYQRKGDYDKAEPLYLEAKVRREKVLGREHPDYVNGLINLALLYAIKGEYDKAELLYLDAKTIHEKNLGNKQSDFTSILILGNLANLYMRKGDNERAEVLYLDAISISEKLQGKEAPEYAVNLNNLAGVYIVKGEFDKAEALFLKAKEINEKVLGKDHLNYASSLNNLANVLLRKKEYDKAEHLYLESKFIREKVLGEKHPDYAASLNYLAILYENIREYNKGEALYLEAKSILGIALGKSHPAYAQSLNYLANFYSIKSEYNKAKLYFTESSSIYKHIVQKSSTYFSSQELEKYIARYQSQNDDFYSFNHLSNSDSVCIISYNNALFYKGFALETASHLEQAMQTAPDSIQDIHSRWKGYNRLLASEFTKPIAERKHAVYLDSMSNVLEKVLLRAVPTFAESQRQIEWQEVRDALQPGEAAIEFIHYRYSNKKDADSTMYSALVTMPGDKAPHFIPLCEARQLDTLISKRSGSRANYLHNLYASPRVDGLPSLKQLLWSPIEKLLREQGIKTAYYSPAGLIHRLNLGAIADGKSGIPISERYRLVPMGSTRQLATDRSKEGHLYLSNALIYGGVRYEMDSSAINSANVKLGATAQDTTGGLFGFARITDGARGENWEYLPGTEKEARYLDSLLHSRGIKTTLRLDYQATEESFKQIGQNAPSPSLLHIGTHGFFFPDPKGRVNANGEEPVFKISEYSMIRSGLKMAGSRYAWENGHPLPGGHEDGILTAYEVSQMNLSNTQLVVLSACETGLGDIRGNEGVYGLQRAFRIAGAKNVLMSLWKVPDDATQKLMTKFYENWLEKKLPLREAFEKAQKWMRGQKGFENPYYWAGFVLVGEL